MKTASTEVMLKTESMSKLPRRIDVIISTWIHFSKSMKSRRTFHVEFRRRTDAEWTKMCQVKCYVPSLPSFLIKVSLVTTACSKVSYSKSRQGLSREYMLILNELFLELQSFLNGC